MKPYIAILLNFDKFLVLQQPESTALHNIDEIRSKNVFSICYRKHNWCHFMVNDFSIPSLNGHRTETNTKNNTLASKLAQVSQKSRRTNLLIE